MSDNKFEIIKSDVNINVELSTSIYERMNQFLFESFPAKDEKHLLELLDLIKEDKDQNDRLAYHLRTLLYIQTSIEKAAREQGAVSYLNEEEFKEKIKQHIHPEDLNTEENQSSPQ